MLLDADATVPMSVCVGLLGESARAIGDDNIGLHVAEHAELGSFDVHFYADGLEPHASIAMRMTTLEKHFVNDCGHSRDVAAAAVRRLPVRRGWSYVDVGCGNGAAALLVADTFGLRAVGVDVDPQQVALARAAAGDRADVRFVTGDATCLPFGDERFDIVATNKTTHHMRECAVALTEMRRILKPRGYLVYADRPGRESARFSPDRGVIRDRQSGSGIRTGIRIGNQQGESSADP